MGESIYLCYVTVKTQAHVNWSNHYDVKAEFIIALSSLLSGCQPTLGRACIEAKGNKRNKLSQTFEIANGFSDRLLGKTLEDIVELFGMPIPGGPPLLAYRFNNRYYYFLFMFHKQQFSLSHIIETTAADPNEVFRKGVIVIPKDQVGQNANALGEIFLKSISK